MRAGTERLQGDLSMRALVLTYTVMALSVLGYEAVRDFIRAEAAQVTEEAFTPSTRPRSARFELYQNREGEHWWRLKAPDGQVIASGEGFKDEASARASIQQVRFLALKASLEEYRVP